MQLQLRGVTTSIEMFVIPASVAHQALSRCAQPLKAWWTLSCCVVVVCCQQQQCCFNQHHVQLGLLSCSQRRSPFMSCLALQAGGGVLGATRLWPTSFVSPFISFVCNQSSSSPAPSILPPSTPLIQRLANILKFSPYKMKSSPFYLGSPLI